MPGKRWLVLVALAVFVGWGMPAAKAAAPAVSQAITVIGENQIAYPQLEGLEDTAVQQKINDDIITKAEIPAHLVTLSMQQEGGWGLVVDYDAYLTEGVLSVVIGAKGEMPNGREGQRYTALTYDLTTGEPVSLSSIFTDAEEAVSWMEERAEATLSDELSGYMEYSDIVPLPTDNFALNADGITFFYPSDQFCLLSGYSGACQFYYEELADYLDWDGLLAQMGVDKSEYTAEEALERITEIVSQGRLPHVPVKIGDEMSEAAEKYRLLREPDRYPGGKFYQMESPEFRQVLILSDALTQGYESSQVLGIQSMRGSLFGIQAGKTTRQEWRGILGEPESTAAFSESLAYDYALPVGESDFYTFGGYQLRLHGDEDGVLHSIRLTQ